MTSAEATDVIELCLHVSTAFQIPSVYTQGSTDEIEEALAIGAFVQTRVHHSRQAEDFKALTESHERELIALKSQHATRAADAALQLEGLRHDLAKQQAAATKALQDATKAVTAARAEEREQAMLEMSDKLEAAKRRLEAAEERKALLEASRTADIRDAEERTRRMLQEALVLREEQVKAGQAALLALEGTYKAQVTELRELNDFLRRRVTNVKVKGNEYEGAFRSLLIQAFGILEHFSVTDTNRNGVGHAGDFIGTLGYRGTPHKVLWEVKNYDKPVPKSEVEKFQRDVLEHSDIQVGVMISRSTEITGKTGKGERELEFLEGKLLVYLSRFEFAGEGVGILQSLLPLFYVWWESRRTLGEEAQEERVLKEALKELNGLLGDLTRRRQEWRVHRSRMEEGLQWMTDVVEEAEERVAAVLKHIQVGHCLDDLDIPEGIFRPLTMDEKIRGIIASIMEHFEVAEGSEVRLTDVSDILATAKRIGKDTARKYVLSALQDSAVVTAPGKPTRIRGLVARIGSTNKS